MYFSCILKGRAGKRWQSGKVLFDVKSGPLKLVLWCIGDRGVDFSLNDFCTQRYKTRPVGSA